MLRTRTFFGVLLLVAGGLLLADSLGLLAVDVGSLWWPLVIVAIGVWILLRSSLGSRALESEDLTIPLEDASSARIRLRHGAGRIRMERAELGTDLLSGHFVGGVKSRLRRTDDRLEVELAVPADRWPDFMGWSDGFSWTIGLRPDIPLDIDLETGAGETTLALGELQVRQLRIKTGASSTVAELPAHAGRTGVMIEAGVASVELKVPEGVAAQIRTRGALTDIKVDSSRFPRSGDRHESPDYASAPNRIDIDVQAGVGSIKIG